MERSVAVQASGKIMAESEYRLLIHEPGPNSDPVPMIVTRARSRRLGVKKSFAGHLWELAMAFLPAVFLGTLLAGWIAGHRPSESYVAALNATPAGETRLQMIETLEQNAQEIVDRSQKNPDRSWSAEFSQTQLNSWLADRFPEMQGEWRRLGLQEPRVLIDPKSIHIGFRIERAGEDEFWSLSLLPKVTGIRQIAFQILGVRMGLVPIPLHRIQLDRQGVIHGENWEVPWKYDKGDHSITIDLPEGSGIPPLAGLEILPETIRFHGEETTAAETSIPAAEVQNPPPTNSEKSPLASP